MDYREYKTCENCPYYHGNQICEAPRPTWEEKHREAMKIKNRIKNFLDCCKELGVIFTIKYKLGLYKDEDDLPEYFTGEWE